MRNQRNNKSKMKRIVIKHIEDNLREYFILMIIFLIGIIFGIIYLNNSNESQQIEIKNYINNFINNIKDNYSVDKGLLLIKSIKNNIVTVILLWLAGCTVIGMPIAYGTIAFKGFCLSYTVSGIMASLGTRKRDYFCIIFNTSAIHFYNSFYICCWC